ncbi:MAG: HEAT repeat domain-containing protein [Burkholderiales bacterium]
MYLGALVGLAIVVALVSRSWVAGAAVLFGVPLALLLIGKGSEAWHIWSALRHARRGLASAATQAQAQAVRSLEEQGFVLRESARAVVRAARLLQPMLSHADPEVRLSAARALCRLGHDVDAALPVLIAQLDSADTRSDALDGLRLLGPAAAPAVPALIAMLPDRRASTWDRAVEVLGCIGPPAKDAVPVLIEAVQACGVDQVGAPVRALASIDDPRALPALEALAAGGKDERVREEAKRALARIRN